MSISLVATLGGDMGRTDASLWTSSMVASVKGMWARSDMLILWSERSAKIMLMVVALEAGG